jgi:predicted methyltransferase
MYSELAKIVIKNRPRARWRYDQVFMNEDSMILQAQKFYHYLENKKIVFLGDGDGASIYYGLLLSKCLVKPIKEMLLLDFDERILNYHNKIYRDYKLDNYYQLLSRKYNVINPTPKKFHDNYDFFYINPPYGALCNGNSIIAWIHRCLDLCVDGCMGCIILPYDKNYDWSIANMKYIEAFLFNKGFIIKEKLINIHEYDFGGTSNLKSSTIIVEKIKKSHSEYKNKKLPQKFTENLYGKPRDIPKYIIDDNSEYGIECFNEE